MNIVGRFHAVRAVGARGIGPRMILERRRAQWPTTLVPDGPEWVRLPSGLVVPAMRGGAGGTYIQGEETPWSSLVPLAATGATQTTLALDSAYVYASAGDAIAGSFRPRGNETLEAVYVFVTAYAGTPANVNDLDMELRSHDATLGPGATLHEGLTLDPAATTGWRAKTGWSFSLTGGTRYWIVCGDADGNGTDFATVLRSTNMLSGVQVYRFTAWQTINGFTTAAGAASAVMSLVLVFDSGLVIGNPITAVATSTSNTNRRGWRFIAPTACKLYGMVGIGSTAASACTGIELWAGTNGPGGSADASSTHPINESNSITTAVRGYVFTSPPTLAQGTAYRCVHTYGSNATTPSKLNIGTGADATLRSARLGGGAWHWAGANGTTDWSNDDSNAMPTTDLLIEDFVTAAAGGGAHLLGGTVIR